MLLEYLKTFNAKHACSVTAQSYYIVMLFSKCILACHIFHSSYMLLCYINVGTIIPVF